MNTRTASSLAALVATIVAAHQANAQSASLESPRTEPAPTQVANSQHHGLQPKLTLGLGGGVGGWTRGMHDAAWVGPAWQFQVGVQLNQWLAFDGVYSGQYNDGVDRAVGTGIDLTNTSGWGQLRLIAPCQHLKPFGFAGFGVSRSDFARRGDTQQATSLQPNTSAIVPFGGGLMLEFDNHWSGVASFTYQYSIGSASTSAPSLSGADVWNTTLGVSYQM